MTTLNTEAAEIIEDAIEIIDRDGWIRGQLEDDDGGKCMLGGISNAWALKDHDNHATPHDLWVRVHSVIEGEVLKGSMPHYNDNVADNWNDCRDKMMEAAKILRERG